MKDQAKIITWEGPTRSGKTWEEVEDKRVKKLGKRQGRMLVKIQTQRGQQSSINKKRQGKYNSKNIVRSKPGSKKLSKKIKENQEKIERKKL